MTFATQTRVTLTYRGENSFTYLTNAEYKALHWRLNDFYVLIVHILEDRQGMHMNTAQSGKRWELWEGGGGG